GDVEGGVAAMDTAADRFRRGEVAFDQLTAERREVGGLGRRPHERDHLVSALPQPARDPSTDEPGAASHECPHLAPFERSRQCPEADASLTAWRAQAKC